MMTALKEPAVWQLQEAKARLSEVVKRTAEAPQIITVHGAGAAVVLSLDNYRKLLEPGTNLYEFMQNSPLRDVDIDFERDNRPCEPRDIGL